MREREKRAFRWHQTLMVSIFGAGIVMLTVTAIIYRTDALSVLYSLICVVCFLAGGAIAIWPTKARGQ